MWNARWQSVWGTKWCWILRYLVNFPETIFLEEKVKLPQKVGGTKFKTKPGDGRRKMSSPCDGGRDEDQGLQSSEQHFLGGENYQWPNSWKTHLFKNFLNLAQILSRAGRDGPGSHTDRARHSCSGWSSSSLSLQYIDCLKFGVAQSARSGKRGSSIAKTQNHIAVLSRKCICCGLRAFSHR